MLIPIRRWKASSFILLTWVVCGSLATIACSRVGVTGSEQDQSSLPSVKFTVCGQSPRVNCVVDGDTFYLDGAKIRMADIDTPETNPSRCEYERLHGQRATLRLAEMLNEGPFVLHQWWARDEDRYGRKLRVVVRDGKSVGDRMVSEGYARTWTGRREPWC